MKNNNIDFNKKKDTINIKKNPNNILTAKILSAFNSLINYYKKIFNKKKKDSRLVISYCFTPYNDSSGNVMAKRVRENNLNVDVLQNDMSDIRTIDKNLDIITEDLIDERIVINSQSRGSFDNWDLISDFSQKGMKELDKIISKKGEYSELYSRSLLPASHFLAFDFKIKYPNTKWIAEFSDPLLYNELNSPRYSPITDSKYLINLNRLLTEHGFSKKNEDNIFFWCEYLPFLFADEIIFTNKNQKNLMLADFPNDFKNFVENKSEIKRHPTLKKEFYDMIDSDYFIDDYYVNFAYFGRDYGNRNLNDVFVALKSLDVKDKNRCKIHIFTSNVKNFEENIVDKSILANLEINPYVNFLEFLNLTKKFDCLIVNDAIKKGKINPFLPSKLSDYYGSGSSIWGLCEEGSALDSSKLTYKSILGDFKSTRDTLEKIIKDKSKKEYYDISVIIPVYNSEKTIYNALSSVSNNFQNKNIEIIVVDDCSTDGTLNILEDICKNNNNIKLIKLEENSGGASKPRNVGISNSNSKYITFLDADDEIDSNNLIKMLHHAKRNNIDFIKGYLEVFDNGNIRIADRLDLNDNNSIKNMENIISKQSTTINVIIKKSFLDKNNIKFNEEYHIGEDTIFYTEIFSHNPKVEYNDYSFYKYYKRRNIHNKSVTAKYGDDELKNHLDVWKIAEKNLNKIGLSYFDLRLPLAIKNSIYSIIYFSNGDISEPCFNKLSIFINNNRDYLKNKMNLDERERSIFNSIIENNYENFTKFSKKRLLIAGYDLKFITQTLTYLEDEYVIKIDEWEDTYTHDENKSNELLKWADIIFCEWLLGNAVWYSKRKISRQKIIIRAHRFELTRDYGFEVNYSNVDAVITVSYYYLEMFSNLFNISREKMFLLNNYIEIDKFKSKPISEENKYNLAIVGYVPKLKGLLRGLQLLKILKNENENFKLHLFGKHYKELSWIWNNPVEREYFETCEKFITDNNLDDSVIFHGWVEKFKLFTNVDYVLSLSYIESFHLSPSEGIVAGSLAFFLDWEGSEYIYPKNLICSDINEMNELILKTYNNPNLYYNLLSKSQDYVIEEFNIENFITNLKIILNNL